MCQVINQKFWNPLITVWKRLTFPNFTHKASFLAVGRLTDDKTVDKNQAGLLFLAWRCLYAELIRGRADDVIPNLDAAYTRLMAMNISRLKAYGERWLRWVRKNKNTGNRSYIPRKHQNKKVIQQDGAGNYLINQIFYDEYKRMTST